MFVRNSEETSLRGCFAPGPLDEGIQRHLVKAPREEPTTVATAKIDRTQRGAGAGGPGGNGFGGQGGTTPPGSTGGSVPQDDPWATQSSGNAGNGPDSEPPF